MKYLLNLWATGFEGIFEIGYSVLGEVALHSAVLIVSVLIFTMLYSGSLGRIDAVVNAHQPEVVGMNEL